MRSSPSKAFSLVELMVALAVLSAILFIFARMIDLTTDTWQAGARKADVQTQARVALGLLERDIESSILRPDLTAFVDQNGDLLKNADGTPEYAFYTASQAPNGDRKVCLATYHLAGRELIRSDRSLNYPGGTADGPRYGKVSQLTDLGATTPQVVTDLVVDFKVQFIDGNGVISNPGDQKAFQIDYSNPDLATNSRAIVVSLLTLDSPAMQLTEAQPGTLDRLRSEFSTPSNNTSYADAWQSDLSSTTFAKTFPAPIRSGVKVYKRILALPLTSVN